MSKKIEDKVDEALVAIAKLTITSEHTERNTKEIKKQMIPNGNKRMEKLETQVDANSKFRYVFTTVAGLLGTALGWILSVLPIGGSH